MPRVSFLADFDFDPDAHGGRVSIAFKAGQERTVTRECAAKAIAAGKATPVKTWAKEGKVADHER